MSAKKHRIPYFLLVVILVLGFGAGVFGSYVGGMIFIQPNGLEGATEQQVTKKAQHVEEVLPESAVIDVAEELSNSVVSVVATQDVEYVARDPFSVFRDPFGDPFFNNFFESPQPQQDEPEVRRERRQVSAGTGFIVSSEGMILTNKHVVDREKADYTVIFSDKSEYKAEVVTRDPTNDIAVLQIIETDKKDFVPVKFVPQTQNVKVGQMVVAIGNALGQFENTVTLGVISATERSIVAGGGTSSPESLRQLLQTDAAINPGNSGGPLVNLQGEVLGINTAIAGNAEGIGFAIPVDSEWFANLSGQIEQHGRIVKPFLGVRYQMITPELNEQFALGVDHGAWLRGDDDLPAVIADTPAAEAGLKGGDIVLKVNDTEVSLEQDLALLISMYNPDDTLVFTILRDGKEQEIQVRLGEWSEE